MSAIGNTSLNMNYVLNKKSLRGLADGTSGNSKINEKPLVPENSF